LATAPSVDHPVSSGQAENAGSPGAPSASPSSSAEPPADTSKAESAKVAPTAGGHKAPGGRVPAQTVHTPPPPPPKDCDPPYTLDAEGHKHYKLNCL
jgi:serine/threonine-protein kinase